MVTANTFLECAQFAGLLAAVKYYAGDAVAVRVVCTLLFCVVVALILFLGDVDRISKALGVVVVVMTVTFTISAAQTGVDLGKLIVGHIPQLPAGSAPQALGMIATTAIPFNVFLASTLAEGRCGCFWSQTPISSVQVPKRVSEWCEFRNRRHRWYPAA